MDGQHTMLSFSVKEQIAPYCYHVQGTNKCQRGVQESGPPSKLANKSLDTILSQNESKLSGR